MQPKDIRNLMESYHSIYESKMEYLEKGQSPTPGGKERSKPSAIPPRPRKGTPITSLPESEKYDMVLNHLIDEGFASSEENAEKIISVMSENWIDSIIEQMVVNVADVKGGTPAAKFAAAGKTNKDGKPMYTPGTGVGADFKLKGV